MIDVLRNIGREMKEYRERMGLKQATLGRMLGVSGGTISCYEREHHYPSLKVVIKFLEIL